MGQEFDVIAGTKVADFITASNPVDYIQGPLGPVSGDTEFLTPRGWKRIDAYTAGDQVGQWDAVTGIVRFMWPTRFFDLPCDEMWHFFNKNTLSMVLSDEHRCPVYDWKGNFCVKSAAQLAAKPSRHTVPVSFQIDAAGIDLTDEQIRLAVAIKADGCMPKIGRQCIVVVRKERKKERMRVLLGAADMEFKESQHGTRPTELRFAFPREGYAKGFDLSWWCASKRQLEIILAECLLWDGLAGHEEQRFFTTRREDADFIQYAAHATGRRATIARRDYEDKPNWKSGYTVSITVPGSQKTRVQLRVDGIEIKRVPAPNGRKYCFETATGFFVARHNDRMFITGNSGKTKACCVRLMRHAQEQMKSPIDGLRRTRFALVRNTMPDLKRSTMRTWLETVPEHIYGKFNSAPGFMQHKIKFNDVSAEFDFMSLDKADDVKKLRSTEYTGIFFNELPFIPKEIFDEADSRLRFPPDEHGGPTWRGIIADGNAPDEDCWLAMMTGQIDLPPGLNDDERAQYVWPKAWGFYMQPPALIEKMDERGASLGFEVNQHAENLKNLPAEYYSRMWPGKSRAWIDSRLMNRVALVVEGNPVWPMFRREYHVAREPLRPIPGHEVLVSLDFGRVYPAALFGQEVNQRLYVQYEMLGFNEPASVFAPKVKKFLTQNYLGYSIRFVGDPKGRDKGQQTEQSSYDIFDHHGMHVVPAPVKMNNIEERTEAVAFALNDNPSGISYLVISPLCRTLIVGMAGRYHLVREEDGELRPKKDKYSNLCDCLQYKIIGRGVGRKMIGMRPIADLKPARIYLGPKTMRRVIA